MRREPVLLIAGLLVAIATAVVQEVGAGHINSLKDILLIALPLIGAALARERVTPV